MDEDRRLRKQLLEKKERRERIATIRDEMQKAIENGAGIYRTGTSLGETTVKLRDLQQRFTNVVLDDRDERPGVKFKDADLVGIPFRVNVGKKVTEGIVEVVQRSTREMHDVSIGAINEYLTRLLRPAR